MLLMLLIGGVLVCALAGWLGADLAITAANVVPITPYTAVTGKLSGPISGNQAITAGMAVYTDGTYWYAAGSGGNSLQSGNQGAGVALNSCPGANQPVSVWQTGTLTLGATLVAGQTYVISATGAGTPQGKIAPVADLVAGNFVTILGVAKDTANLISIASGVGTAVAHG